MEPVPRARAQIATEAAELVPSNVIQSLHDWVVGHGRIEDTDFGLRVYTRQRDYLGSDVHDAEGAVGITISLPFRFTCPKIVLT